MKKTRYSILPAKIAPPFTFLTSLSEFTPDAVKRLNSAFLPRMVKKTVAEAIVFFREGISYLWGIAKNYKNVLGGYK